MAQARPPWWIVVLAATFLGYHALLFYCDARLPEADGILFRFDRGRMLVADVKPATAAERSGVAAGDVVLECDGHVINSQFDWDAHLANVEVGRPLRLTIERAGVRRDV